MTLQLLPQEAGSDTIDLWVGAFDEPIAGLSVAIAGTGRLLPVPDGADEEIAAAGHVFRCRRLTVPGLTPGRAYAFELRSGVTVHSTADATTLPATLPTLGQRPFTVLLGSCFAVHRDGAGNAGRAARMLPSDARPDIKLLCGDQVYLDQPLDEFLVHTHDTENLTRLHLATYTDTWLQRGTLSGFAELLAHGANFFVSDDHDLWNNAPFPTAIARDTWGHDGRDRWMAVAARLYHAFQRRPSPAVRTFEAGPLSFCLFDTRLDRMADRSRFALPDDMATVAAWARGLRGPGILLTGQVLFAAGAGWKGNFMDWGLPDFRQYRDLVTALATAPHSVVFMTGDVHYGRVAVCRRDPLPDLVEVVASPLSLVAPVPPNDWHAAPERFPVDGVPGVVGMPVTTAPYSLRSNHFATVEFAQTGGFVRMRARAWPVDTNGAAPTPTAEFQHWLQ